MTFVNDDVSHSYMEWLELFAHQCLLANSAVNVVIYGAFTTDFKKAYVDMLSCSCKTRIPSEAEVTSP